jgi:hypothetical protein
MSNHISEFMPSVLSLISKSEVPVTEADDLEIGIDYCGRVYETLSEHDIAPHINRDGSVNWESLEAWASEHNGTIVDRYKDGEENTRLEGGE